MGRVFLSNAPDSVDFFPSERRLSGSPRTESLFPQLGTDLVRYGTMDPPPTSFNDRTRNFPQEAPLAGFGQESQYFRKGPGPGTRFLVSFLPFLLSFSIQDVEGRSFFFCAKPRTSLLVFLGKR